MLAAAKVRRDGATTESLDASATKLAGSGMRQAFRSPHNQQSIDCLATAPKLGFLRTIFALAAPRSLSELWLVT